MTPPQRYEVTRAFDTPRGTCAVTVGWAIEWETGEVWLLAGPLRAQTPTLAAMRAQFTGLTFNAIDAPTRIAADQAERRAIQESVEAVERAAETIAKRCA